MTLEYTVEEIQNMLSKTHNIDPKNIIIRGRVFPNDTLCDSVRKDIENDKTIEAIKLVKQGFNISLIQAKEIVNILRGKK